MTATPNAPRACPRRCGQAVALLRIKDGGSAAFDVEPIYTFDPGDPDLFVLVHTGRLGTVYAQALSTVPPDTFFRLRGVIRKHACPTEQPAPVPAAAAAAPSRSVRRRAVRRRVPASAKRER